MPIDFGPIALSQLYLLHRKFGLPLTITTRTTIDRLTNKNSISWGFGSMVVSLPINMSPEQSSVVWRCPDNLPAWLQYLDLSPDGVRLLTKGNNSHVVSCYWGGGLITYMVKQYRIGCLKLQLEENCSLQGTSCVAHFPRAHEH